MCLVALAIGVSDRFPVVVIANRDEFFDRPTAPLGWWSTDQWPRPMLSGRDQRAGGAWLGVTRRGRIALVTNVREPAVPVPPAASSRGTLVPAWLQAEALETPVAAALNVPRSGYNVIAVDIARSPAVASRGLWLSNRAPEPRLLSPGLYGLSNALLDTPWPKLTSLKSALASVLRGARTPSEIVHCAFAALADERVAADGELPDTGVGLQRERQLSAPCVRIHDAAGRLVYGTRCSTVIVVAHDAAGMTLHAVERTYGDTGTAAVPDVSINFDLAESS